MTKKEKAIITKAKWVDNVMIRSHHKIAICISEEDFKFELRRLNVPETQWDEWLSDDSSAYTHVFDSVDNNKPSKIVIICVRPKQEEAIFYLIHEAVHIYQEEMRYIGETTPSDEFMSYSIEAIATNLIKGYLEKPTVGRKGRKK
jgi:hypothetical protein